MAETDWSAPSDWGGQAGGMFGQTQSAMGWGGGYGMPQQSPWSSPYSGFGGGMGYGGGGGMQSPYGAPMGMGSYSPQAYGMQSMGAPQQQAMMAAAPQAGTNQMVPSPNLPAQSSSWEDILKNIPGIGDNKGGLFGGNQKIEQTFNPWAPQGAGLQDLYKKANAEYDAQRKLGAPQFAQESQYALNRMEDVAKGKNPLVAQSLDAVKDIASGGQQVGGGMFQDLYNRPGISTGNYAGMINDPAQTGLGRYLNEYQQSGSGAGEDQYRRMANQDAIGTRNYNEIRERMEHPGSLAGGMFGEVARGDRVDSNPYREQAITNAMNQASDATKAGMSARGRYGGSAYGDAMGRALGEVATNARMQGYDTDTANMMTAAQARSGEGLQRAGIGLQAAQGVAGAQSQNAQQQLEALRGLTGASGQAAQQRMNALQGYGSAQSQNVEQRLAAQQALTGAQRAIGEQQLDAARGYTGIQSQNIANRLSAAGMAPQMQGLRYDDMNRLLGIGATREAQTQQQRDFGWNQMGQLQGVYGQLPGSAGSQTQPGQPWWQQAAGLGMLGLGMMGGGA
jgi:hypothetical protein